MRIDEKALLEILTVEELEFLAEAFKNVPKSDSKYEESLRSLEWFESLIKKKKQLEAKKLEEVSKMVC